MAGDVLVASIAVRPSTAVITPPGGWTLLRRIDNALGKSNTLAVYWRVAVVGESASHAWSFSTSTGSVGVIAAFYGADPSSPIDVENGQSTPTSLTHDTPSVTTTRTQTMLMTAHAFSSSASWTPPLGMAEALEVASQTVPNGAGISLEVNYALQPAAGATGVKSATASSGADTGNAEILALSPSP
jgi:MSHA biogenesis protein MshQ